MIRRSDADEIAEQFVREQSASCGIECVLVRDETEDVGFGWAYFFDSKEYVETREFSAALTGNWPFVVEKKDGTIHRTDVESSLEDLTRRHGL